MDLSIIIPAYNEEARLGRMLDKYLPFFNKRYAAGYEILVVVNGSCDHTEDVVREYARTHSHIRVIVDPRPIGKGGAIMLGFAQAQGCLVGFVDADGATPPEAFQELVEHIGAAGAIIASRWMPGARISVEQPFKRRLASRLFNALVRLMFGLRISDTQCGAKLLTRDAVQAILPHIGITQWAFDVDLLFQLRRAGFAITEIPTTWQDVSGSRLRVGKASADMFVAMVRLRLIYSPFRWGVALYDRTLARYMQN
ncbi:MAG: glycosyltransferase family 2 protein [Kiritimatiellota bacterium]|nr:glycosyltransferase family 2 protein [Kiritimatiellota bacterium]